MLSSILLAAFDWSTLGTIGVVIKVAIGLGAVIFVHELGHFLVAKMCGVKIEKFMIGFDIGGYKLSWRRGETIYGIGILPLGGYVKMLGQDDDPAHIAEQMKKSQVESHHDNAVPIKGPDGSTYYVDRRSYLAKSVPQRMAIISAGVVMNMIFAFIFAVIAYGMGVPYVPSIVSETMPGSPAWHADIQSGDEIVQLGKRPDPTFIQLKGGVTLGDLEQGIDCHIRRAADGRIENVQLKPRQKDGRLATIGILPPFSLTLFGEPPVIEDSPAANAVLVKPAASELPTGQAKLMDGDQIIRIGDVPIRSYPEFSRYLAGHPGKTLQITVRRQKADQKRVDEGGNSKTSAEAIKNSQELTFEVPAQALHRFDFSMKMGPITSVQEGSPAAKAGFLAGDIVEQVDGKRLGEGPSATEKWDALTLPDYLRRAATEKREVELTVIRSNARGAHDQVKVRVKPQLPTMARTLARPPGTPMAADEIGIAYQIANDVALVVPNTPAAADLAPGDRILQAKVILPKDKAGNIPEPIIVKLVHDETGWFGTLSQKMSGGAATEQERLDWPRLIDIVQFVPAGTKVEFTVQRGNAEARTMTITPVVAEDAFIATRGFWFRQVERTRKAESIGQQIRYGWDETSDALTMVFRFLKKIGTQVPLSALGGPVTIAKAAGYSAAEGLSSLLIFLTVLSANLAVLNFLPIPLLDGGHMVFLAYEGIRGRPASEKFVVALHTVGFVFIVSLMLYVIALDLNIIPRAM
ncbi:MAG TPA: site-2 protease family protein [Lacipirellulaceae bacterium]|nr:site-2 protease family protein [Lacipirellulaceae bacterium]